LKAGLDALEKRKNLLLLPGIEPQFLGHPAYSTLIIPNELTQLYVITEKVKHPLHFNSKVR
jgi:hypothetical protein